MNDLSNPKVRIFLQDHAKDFDDSKIVSILENGVSSEEDVVALARFYWQLVENTVEQDVESLLEKAYTSLHIHCNNLGYGDVWNHEMP